MDKGGKPFSFKEGHKHSKSQTVTNYSVVECFKEHKQFLNIKKETEVPRKTAKEGNKTHSSVFKWASCPQFKTLGSLSSNLPKNTNNILHKRPCSKAENDPQILQFQPNPGRVDTPAVVSPHPSPVAGTSEA